MTKTATDRTPQSAKQTARTLPCRPLPDHIHLNDGTVRLPPLLQKDPLTITDGEELVLAGLIARQPQFDGIVIFPAAASTLWVHISAEEVVSMRRFATGALFSALFEGEMTMSTSVLEALSDAMSRPELVALKLSSLQTSVMLATPEAAQAPAEATALLIGQELAATRAYWLGQPVMLIGSEALCAPYITALEAQFVPVTRGAPDSFFEAGVEAALEKVAS